jgi:hypothetical protein
MDEKKKLFLQFRDRKKFSSSFFGARLFKFPFSETEAVPLTQQMIAIAIDTAIQCRVTRLGEFSPAG